MGRHNQRTKKIKILDKFIGGGSNILVQSMTNTRTSDVSSTVKQILELEDAKCDVVRVAVPDIESARAIREIKKYIKIPIVADIHFDYRLAIASIENGADKIRINPGNIYHEDRVKHILSKAKEYKIPIRIGLNSGSLPKNSEEKFKTTDKSSIMYMTALEYIDLFEKNDFFDIVVSLKSSNVNETIQAYRLISEKINYPLHLGATHTGMLKAAVAVGSLLSQGIGDTIRISLTSDPIKEVQIALDILKSLEYIKSGIEIISCPTCGRCKLNIIKIVSELETQIKILNLDKIDKNIKIAIMGCGVNGPGEAKGADIGIAGGDGHSLLFKDGKIIKKVAEEDIVHELIEHVVSFLENS